MSRYFENLRQILGGKYEIGLDDFKFSGLAGKQRWAKVINCADLTIIYELQKISSFPMVILAEQKSKREAITRFLDLGDNYSNFLKSDKTFWNDRLMFNPIRYIDNRVIYCNYSLFGNLMLSFKEPQRNYAREIINTWETYGLDLALFITEVVLSAEGNVYVKLLPDSSRFIRYGLLWGHKIPPNNNRITVSFLVPFLKLNLMIAKVLAYENYMSGLFANKSAFLDYYEKKVFSYICSLILDKEYKPDRKPENPEIRIRRMYEFLINDSKFIKLAKKRGYQEEINVL